MLSVKFVQSLSIDILSVFAGLTEIIKSHTFVGMADDTLALIQHGTRLLLANISLISKAMFYQQVWSAMIDFAHCILFNVLVLSAVILPLTLKFNPYPVLTHYFAFKWQHLVSTSLRGIFNTSPFVSDGQIFNEISKTQLWHLSLNCELTLAVFPSVQFDWTYLMRAASPKCQCPSCHLIVCKSSCTVHL